MSRHVEGKLRSHQVEGLPGPNLAVRPQAGVGADKVHAGPPVQRVEMVILGYLDTGGHSQLSG
jgi:hypothetical protein